MSLILYKSNRLETLVRHLVETTLRVPLSSPLVPEHVVVETLGMAQWLKLEVSKRQGVVANLELPFPRAFISGLIQALVPAEAQAGAIEPQALTWRIMGRLDALLPQQAFDDLRNYLSDTDDPRRKFQLAERVASLLDQYSVYRPNWIARWQVGDDSHWQAILWRAVMTDGLACQGKFLYELIQVLKNPACDRSLLPERLSIFAPSSLPPSYLAVFDALAMHIPVHLFCLCPCREYWGDIVSPWEGERIQSKAGDGTIDPQDLHLEAPNSLLGSCGKTGRAFQQLVSDLDGIGNEIEDFAEPGTGNLLTCIQSSILELQDKPGIADRILVKPDDRSIQVHACHSPLRELQVLRDQLLDWFSADPSLSPQDVVVMLPDVEGYAPYIKGIFDNAEPGSPAIPYTLADRGARQESALVDGFASFLQLSSSRLTATTVVDFFETATVRRRFGVAEEELEQIRLWIQKAGIRWGRDAEHRTKLGLPGFTEHSWEHGCSRLLLGYAMADGEDTLVHDLLPCEGIEGTATSLLGRWLDFIEQLFAALAELSAARNLEGWAGTLNQMLDTLFAPEPEEEGAATAIRQILDDLRQQQTISGFNQPVPLPVVLERILPRLSENRPGKAFLRGAVTFCGLNPMRGIPFRVMCLLGMQDRSFPRSPVPPSFDLMAQQPQPGDESRREDDRYLFLESLLAARDRFYLSYVGQSVRDNTPRPPSVVISELLDFIGSRFRLEGAPEDLPGAEPRIIRDLLVTIHRLHAFSPSYFRQVETADPRLFGYSPALARVGQFLADPASRSLAETFLAQPLTDIGEEWKTASLRNLQWFFRNPSRFFVEKRLEFRLPEDKELLQEEEPFSLDGLEAFQCKQEILESLFTQRSRSSLIAAWKGSGQLPPGPTGALVANGVFAAVDPLFRRVQARIGEALIVREPLELKIAGFTLEGQLSFFSGVGLVHYRAAKVDPKKKAEANLKLWIEHLFFQLTGSVGPKQSYLVGEDGTWGFSEVPEAEAYLRELLELHLRGLSAPLPFFPKTSFMYAIGQAKGAETAQELASETWEGDEDDEFKQGEKEDPYFNLCFRNHPDPLSSDFQTIARQVVSPMLKHQTKEEES
jgi:exodeoxyribonuclease V gamma subunit